MKLSIAASLLIATRSAEAACESQMTIDVPSGITGLSFVGYSVDPSKITRSTGSVRVCLHSLFIVLSFESGRCIFFLYFI